MIDECFLFLDWIRNRQQFDTVSLLHFSQSSLNSFYSSIYLLVLQQSISVCNCGVKVNYISIHYFTHFNLLHNFSWLLLTSDHKAVNDSGPAIWSIEPHDVLPLGTLLSFVWILCFCVFVMWYFMTFVILYLLLFDCWIYTHNNKIWAILNVFCFSLCRYICHE